MSESFVGIDVATECLHCVAVDEGLRIIRCGCFQSDELEAVVEWASDAGRVAIDAPEALSARPHKGDRSLKPKFRNARCCEIDLGRSFRIWVPWVAPTSRPKEGWMKTGFEVYDIMGKHGFDVIEVYPHACYRVLAGSARLPNKRKLNGQRMRLDALRSAGVVLRDDLSMWSHDALDALVAALTARDHRLGTAVAATCGHDASAIWLPSSPQAASL